MKYNKLIANEFENLLPKKSDIVEIASSLLGKLSVRYTIDHPELGQSPEKGFDCSGFARFVLVQAGLYIPDYIGMDGIKRQIRHASEFWDHYGVNIGSKIEGGDLIFFSRGGEFPTHIGIVRDEESYIHAPGNNNSKVRIDAIKKECIIPRDNDHRMLYDINPIGFKALTKQHPQPNYRYHQELID